MTSRPEIIRHTVGPEDEFLVLACDGLFDVMTNQKAVNFVRKTLEVRDLSYYLRITAFCYLFFFTINQINPAHCHCKWTDVHCQKVVGENLYFSK